MLARLIHKELLTNLLDFRFVAVFALCALLSVLAVYMGVQNQDRRLSEYNAVSEANRKSFETRVLGQGRLWNISSIGYRWNRRPESLSPVVFGLSGLLGREAIIRSGRPARFETSLYGTDPAYALFEVLDLAFIVKIVLSLAVILFTFDAICGEKEAGTLRLYSSFGVSRSLLAVGKLLGSTIVVLTPFLFSFLLSSLVLTLTSDLNSQDWFRMAFLMFVFTLYLVVFAAFGLWISALTHRRIVAFLGLLCLWTIWIFIIPTLSADLANEYAPVGSFHTMLERIEESQNESQQNQRTEVMDYLEQNQIEDRYALPEDRRKTVEMAIQKIRNRWATEHRNRYSALEGERRRQIRQQHETTSAISILSPFRATELLARNLARTGFKDHQLMTNALSSHLITLAAYTQSKWMESYTGDVDLTDFPWFTYELIETFDQCLIADAFHILNLVLLAILGFAGAYVAILRYDVR